MKTPSKLIAACFGSLALAVTAGLGGYMLGESSSQNAQTLDDNAYTQARATFCNLQFTSDGEATRVDYRSVQNLDADLLIADDVCTDDLIQAWNEAQASAGVELRACRYDWEADLLAGVIGLGRCVAPAALN